MDIGDAYALKCKYQAEAPVVGIVSEYLAHAADLDIVYALLQLWNCHTAHTFTLNKPEINRAICLGRMLSYWFFSWFFSIARL